MRDYQTIGDSFLAILVKAYIYTRWINVWIAYWKEDGRFVDRVRQTGFLSYHRGRRTKYVQSTDLEVLCETNLEILSF